VRKLASILAVFLALCVTGAAEETGEVAAAESDAPGAKFFKAGLAVLKEANDIKSADERIARYRDALAQFDAAVAERKDFYFAHASAAHCLMQITALTTNAPAHQELFAQAIRRCETASQCPGVETRLFGSWASFLITESGRLPDAAKRRAMIEQAVKILENGQRLADTRVERLRLEYQFGRAKFFLAQVSDNRPERRALYESARDHFQAASEIDSIAKLPALYSAWGLDLLELSRLCNDPMLLRQAIERLQTSLEKDPSNVTVRYNIVCAYALMGQTENAMRHLQFCLDHDDAKRTYFNAAQQDPDLDSLRATPEYNKIFDAATARPLYPFEKPTFSDR